MKMLSKYISIRGWQPRIAFIDTDFAERNGILDVFKGKNRIEISIL